MINCTELKTKIEARIEERKAQQAELIRRYEQKLSDSRATWWGTHGPLWERAVGVMREALDEGEPIGEWMLPKAGYREYGTWSEPSGRPAEEYHVPDAVTMLLAVLEVHGEDKITTTELSRLGIGVEQWRTVNRFLSRAWS